MRQFQESIRPLEGIPAGRQSNWECQWQVWKHLGAPVTSLGAPRITVEQPGKNNILCGNAASAPGNPSYNVLFNDFQNSCIPFIFSFMYLYSATLLQSVNQDSLQAVHERNLSCAPKWRLSKLRDKLGGHNWARLHMHLKAVSERHCRYTWRSWSSECRDALRDCDGEDLQT